MIVEHNSAHDQLYIYLRDDLLDATVRTVELDERRRLDYTAEGELVGVELDQPSCGVDLDGMPEREAVVEVLERLATEHGWARARA